MQNIHISWSGDVMMREAVREGAVSRVRQLTDEHRGNVHAYVHIHKSSNLRKVPVTKEDQLFLAVFESDFVVIVDVGFVNIRELIFMYDNEKAAHTELPVYVQEILLNM